MNFWDTSAVVPLCFSERDSQTVRAILKQDPEMVVWWGCIVECHSTWSRLVRQRILTPEGAEQARLALAPLEHEWVEVEPSPSLRDLAGRLTRLHPLSAADAFQLAAALTWCRHRPDHHHLITYDQRLSDAAKLEGFKVLPAPSMS